jgi:hypothetical protein
MPSIIRRDGKTDIADRLRATAEDLVELVSAQVKLVRLELLGDARTLGGRLARLAVFAPVLVLGYGFLAAAGTCALARPLGWPAALALVGAVQVVAGGLGVWRVSRQLRQVRVMGRSREELERSLDRVAATRPATEV